MVVTSQQEGQGQLQTHPATVGTDLSPRVDADRGSASKRPSDAAMWSWLGPCRELARSELDGIEDPARELADLADGNRPMMERARRVLRDALRHEPGNPVLRQMYSLWRRAFEKGSWTWVSTSADRTPFL